MAIIPKHSWWYRNRPSLEFYFSLWPIIRFQTELLVQSFERGSFEVCRFELHLFKRRLLAFNLYKRRLDF